MPSNRLHAGSPAEAAAGAEPHPEPELRSGPRAPPSGLRSGVVYAGPLGQPMTSKRERDRAVKELLDRHYVAVWRTLLRLGLDDDRAHDAALEVFMVGSNKLERIQPGCERRFLLRTAVMIAANFRRMSWVRHEVSNEHAVEQHLDPDPQADQLIYNRHLRQKLAEILDSLPDELRAVFVLFELEGLSAPEIAEITGAKAGTVASRLRRARQLFQRSVQRLKARGLIEGGSP